MTDTHRRISCFCSKDLTVWAVFKGNNWKISDESLALSRSVRPCWNPYNTYSTYASDLKLPAYRMNTCIKGDSWVRRQSTSWLRHCTWISDEKSQSAIKFALGKTMLEFFWRKTDIPFSLYGIFSKFKFRSWFWYFYAIISQTILITRRGVLNKIKMLFWGG